MTQQQLDWYNRGIMMLMAVMNGREDIDDALRAVFDQWRKEGSIHESIRSGTD